MRVLLILVGHLSSLQPYKHQHHPYDWDDGSAGVCGSCGTSNESMFVTRSSTNLMMITLDDPTTGELSYFHSSQSLSKRRSWGLPNNDVICCLLIPFSTFISLSLVIPTIVEHPHINIHAINDTNNTLIFFIFLSILNHLRDFIHFQDSTLFHSLMYSISCIKSSVFVYCQLH